MSIPFNYYKKMRMQFENIWKNNTVEVKVVRKSNIKKGEFFHENDSSDTNERTIKLNIQAGRKIDESLIKQGYFEEEDYTCYATYDTDVKKTDYIKWDGKLWKIVNYEKDYFQGKPIFIKFGIKRVDNAHY